MAACATLRLVGLPWMPCQHPAALAGPPVPNQTPPLCVCACNAYAAAPDWVGLWTSFSLLDRFGGRGAGQLGLARVTYPATEACELYTGREKGMAEPWVLGVVALELDTCRRALWSAGRRGRRIEGAQREAVYAAQAAQAKWIPEAAMATAANSPTLLNSPQHPSLPACS